MKISFPIAEAEIKIKDKFVSCHTDTENNLFFNHAQIKKMLNSDIPSESLIRIHYDNYAVLEDKSICVKNAHDILYNEHGTCIMVSLVYKEHEFKETMYLFKRIMNSLVCNEDKQLVNELCSDFDMDISDIFDIMNYYSSKITQDVSTFPPYEDKNELFNALPDMYKKFRQYLSQQVLVTSLEEIPFDKKLFPITDERRVDINRNEPKNLSTVANEFGMTEQELIDILKEEGIFAEDNLPRQEYIDEGYFEIGYQNIDDSSDQLDIKVFPDPDSLFDNKYFRDQLVHRSDVLDKVKPHPIDEESYCMNITMTAHERGISLEEAELMLRSRGLRITYPNDKADRWLFRKPEANN